VATNVLEIPSIYNVPTKAEVFRDVTGSGSSLGCDCNPRKQGGGPSSGPQNPYQLPAPQGLGQPAQPQKPFQPVGQDPCQPVAEALKGLGIDPDCLKKMMGRGSAAPRKAKSKSTPRKKRTTKYTKRRSATKLTQKQLFPKATSSKKKRGKSTGEMLKTIYPMEGGRYRLYRTKSGGRTCYDSKTRRFVKMQTCINASNQ